ncbi:hypothetical protein SmJEL517_g01771 [Synchytrium microbalum]|uniref:Uncharacterized protein n=1 Tax=Synchytrium microbalum TaxID=1806994 RepID=A0A507C3D7_9FUNG|nr:uncharacterized protein SmJEL517_g01771 [Synchytrium microbalum]TPX36030.1 hypothetical protein SmJEL517_g01771 [Synchytrium microbalum]
MLLLQAHPHNTPNIPPHHHPKRCTISICATQKPANAVSFEHTVVATPATPSAVVSNTTLQSHSLKAITTPAPDEIRTAAISTAHTAAVSHHLGAAPAKALRGGDTTKHRLHHTTASYPSTGQDTCQKILHALVSLRGKNLTMIATSTHKHDSGGSAGEKKVAKGGGKSCTHYLGDGVLDVKVAGHQGL